MKKIFIACLILIGLSSAAQEQQKERLSLKYLIERLIIVNHSILMSVNQVDIARNNVTAAPFIPSLTASAVQKQNLGDTQSNNIDAGLQISWRMFDGGAMFYQYSRSKEQLVQAELQFYSKVETMSCDLIASYNYIISLRSRVDLGEQTVKVSKERYNEAAIKYSTGAASGLEMQLAKTDLNADSSSLITIRQALDVAYIRMAGLLNMEYSMRDYVQDSIVMDSLPDFTTLAAQTELSNTQILLARKGARITDLDLRTARAARYPTLDFGAGAAIGLKSALPANSWSNSFGGSWGFTVGATLFNGSEVTRRIKNAKIEQKNAEIMIESVINDVMTSFNEQYLTYRNNLQLITFENENAEAMALNLDVAMERYRLGELSGLDFRNIQLQYLGAKERQISTLYQAKLSQIELMLLSGSLL